jgi:hypothetical protein
MVARIFSSIVRGIKPTPGNHTPPPTTNPILRKQVQFRVGAIPSEPKQCNAMGHFLSLKETVYENIV